ncbi:hypothetical protein EDB85DRAFT_2240126 [Lactarius pseudohatsudake]|nr:hypothetical protein EDB85DRAFT_2240126 [Lactarius pseudohatsudake]
MPVSYSPSHIRARELMYTPTAPVSFFSSHDLSPRFSACQRTLPRCLHGGLSCPPRTRTPASATLRTPLLRRKRRPLVVLVCSLRWQPRQAPLPVGSTIGHGISSMLFGGRSEAAPAEQQHQAAPQQNTSSFSANCEGQAKEFSKCIEKADLQSCSWYLEQLKACQTAASQY